MKAIQIAYSQKSSASRAASAIRSQLKVKSPKMVLYFASTAYPPEEIAAAMEKAFAPAVVFGCTTAGEIVSGAMLKQSVVAMSFGSEIVGDVSVEVLHGLRGMPSSPDPVPAAFEALGRHFGTPLEKLDPTRHVGIVLVDGLSGAQERILAAMGVRTDVPFVGGSAGDDLAFKATHVFAHGKAHGDAGLVAILKAERGFAVLKTQSFARMGKQLVATRVRETERMVMEFNGKPASHAYASALGVPVEALSEHFVTHPVGIVAEEEPFVRSPRELSGNSVKFFCAVRRGMQLEILRSTDIVDETRQALEEKTRELGGVSAMVNFNCFLRTQKLEKEGATEAYGQLFADVPTIGFNTYGEEYLGHMNQTATILMLQ